MLIKATETFKAISVDEAFVKGYDFACRILPSKAVDDAEFVSLVLSAMDMMCSTQRLVYKEEAGAEKTNEIDKYLKKQLEQYGKVKTNSGAALPDPYTFTFEKKKYAETATPTETADVQKAMLNTTKLYRSMSWGEYFHIYNRMAFPSTGGHFSPTYAYSQGYYGDKYNLILEFSLSKSLNDILVDAITKDVSGGIADYLTVHLGTGELDKFKTALNIDKGAKKNQSNRYSIKNESGIVSLGLGYGIRYGSCLVPEIQDALTSIKLVEVLGYSKDDEERIALLKLKYDHDEEGLIESVSDSKFEDYGSGSNLSLSDVQFYCNIDQRKEYGADSGDKITYQITNAIK